MAHESKADKQAREQEEDRAKWHEDRPGVRHDPKEMWQPNDDPSPRSFEGTDTQFSHPAEPKAVHAPTKPGTVRMKFDGNFVGKEKRVPLPIPLLAQADATGEQLVFTRGDEHTGPAFCDVPPQWATKLLEIGGHFKVADKGE